MPLIQTFPPEILSLIFEDLPDLSSAALASLVCRQWHDAAVADSELWLTIVICDKDIDRPEILGRILARSKGRPLALALRFPSSLHKQRDYEGLYSLLRHVVREHLRHCGYLFIHAHETAWTTVLGAFAGEQFPLLRVLDVRNYDAVAQWQTVCPIPPDPTVANIPLYVPAPMPPKHIVFPLPPGHRLFDAHTQGLSLGDIRLPNADRLCISHHFPEILVEGRLNPWLCHASELIIQRMCVPGAELVHPDDAPVPPTRLEHLTLSELRATPSGAIDPDDVDEDDCGPFFSALDTSRLRSLFINAFDLDGRIWDDFIGALPVAHPKFPLVIELKIRQIDFSWMPSEDIGFFLGAFPALQRFVIVDCFEGTWQDVIEVLEMCPALCVGLKELEVDDGVILRDDPSPFREVMFYDELGNDACDV
ncbi:hypothetical protein B0H17DRAFT_1236088 [Mycena rosella]|uniref:F-box domain-containing protein n=1 Tax=Mycena rosella TaxID=1033263 RepID=A0AAD7D4E8_MYCRO|nr:hypothetical protein B0H17DRAFT_1236088 [Mycena rosella]